LPISQLELDLPKWRERKPNFIHRKILHFELYGPVEMWCNMKCGEEWLTAATGTFSEESPRKVPENRVDSWRPGGRFHFLHFVVFAA
jgi:hypothetical protein